MSETAGLRQRRPTEKQKEEIEEHEKLLKESKVTKKDLEESVLKMEEHSHMENNVIRKFLLAISLCCAFGNIWVEYTVHKTNNSTTYGIPLNILSVLLYIYLAVRSLYARLTTIKNLKALVHDEKFDYAPAKPEEKDEDVKGLEKSITPEQPSFMVRYRISDFLQAWPTIILVISPLVYMAVTYNDLNVFEIVMPGVLSLLFLMIEIVLMIVQDNAVEVNQYYKTLHEMDKLHRDFDEAIKK